MGAFEPNKFKLYIFRYVDNVLRGESVNLAICLVEDSEHPPRFMGFETIQDWARVQSVFPMADIESLKSWCGGTARDLQQSNSLLELLSELENLSTNITVHSQPLTSDKSPDVEMRVQAALHLR